MEQRRAEQAQPIPRSRAKRLLEARRRLEEELEVERRANAEYEAYRARGVMQNGRRFGSPPKPYQPPERPAGKINLSSSVDALVDSCSSKQSCSRVGVDPVRSDRHHRRLTEPG